jgi:hypothetical protein
MEWWEMLWGVPGSWNEDKGWASHSGMVWTCVLIDLSTTMGRWRRHETRSFIVKVGRAARQGAEDKYLVILDAWYGCMLLEDHPLSKLVLVLNELRLPSHQLVLITTMYYTAAPLGCETVSQRLWTGFQVFTSCRTVLERYKPLKPFRNVTKPKIIY